MCGRRPIRDELENLCGEAVRAGSSLQIISSGCVPAGTKMRIRIQCRLNCVKKNLVLMARVKKKSFLVKNNRIG